MKKDLSRKILCSILAAGLCGTASLALAANSGGEMTKVNFGFGENDAYIGNNGTGSNNEVYFDDNDNNDQIYVIGGYAARGEASSNSLTVNGTTVKYACGGYAYSGTANNNSVVISDSTVSNYVYGGNAFKGTANNNSVVISDSNVGNNVYGGYVYIIGEANNNSVVISDSNVSSVYGGYTFQGAANNNSVVVIDSTVSNYVYGGYVYGSGGTANNNSVTIAGSSDLTNASLFGRNGYADGSTGNKLILIGFNGGDKTVNSLNYFDSIEVKALDKNENYVVGTTYTVLTATNSSGDKIKDCQVGEASQIALIGVAKEAYGTVAIDNDNTITFAVNDIQASRQSAITTEARAGVTAFVNQGAEVVADNLNMLSQSAEGINTFATVSGNNSKYDTGSYADINGWNSIVGIASTKEIGKDKLNYGAFFENGSGNYNTYNEIGGAGLRGDGNVLYNGGGVMVRLDKENGFYTEAAVRAGSVKNEAGKGLSDGLYTYDYETENAYYGGHIGIGKIFKLENGKAWDVYGKYFHMHHEGDSVEIAGDTFDFDSVDSNKLRIGARFTETQSEKLTSYYGLAWDYEFSGDVKGTAGGYDMHTPSLEGSTVIGEIGFRYTPGKESPWYFDANVKGYAGVQEGLSGSLQAVYSF